MPGAACDRLILAALSTFSEPQALSCCEESLSIAPSMLMSALAGAISRMDSWRVISDPQVGGHGSKRRYEG